MNVNSPGFRNLPFFLADTAYKNPEDLSKSNWQHMNKADPNFFQWLESNSSISQDFGQVMMAYSASKPTLTEVYPIENLLTGWKKGAPLLVDVGGSHGHDIEKLRARLQEPPPGSLIVQDLEGPIS